jgi:hypothetical protein
MRKVSAAALAVLLAASTIMAQDSVPARPAWPVDPGRAAPFRSTYQMRAFLGDSSQVIGERSVDMVAATYSDAPAWLLVERRTGAVAAVESLYVSPDMRPLRWSASVGPATLAMVFARDSVFGATSGPGGRQSILAPVAPKTIISVAMLEAILPILPLTAYFTDSVSIMSVAQSSTGTVTAELAVIGEEEGTARWIMALRAPGQTLILWVEKATGQLVRTQQPLPLHTASLLEFHRVELTTP